MMNKKEFEKYLKNSCENIIQEPLTTEDGFINEACMNELNDAIINMPKTHTRLSNDLEWSDKRWTFKKDITQGFAKYAICQSPYACPDNLEKVINYLDTCLEKDINWGKIGMVKLSLCDISKLLYDILYEQNISYFDNWNKSKKGNVEIKFVSRYSDKGSPDYDSIDLDALLMNVCLDIRLERRASDKFNKEFEEKYGKLSAEDL